MKSVVKLLCTWSLVPTSGLLITHSHAAPFRSVPSSIATPGSTPVQLYPTPLPADISQVTVGLLHFVHHRWKPTAVIHVDERARFALRWTADSGRLYTPAAAHLTLSRNGSTIYQAYRADTIVRSFGSFQWTIRLRNSHLVGSFHAEFDMQLNNNATGSLDFTLTSLARPSSPPR